MPSPVTLRALVDRYFDEELPYAVPNTRDQYKSVIKHLVLALGHEPNVDDFNVATVRLLVEHLRAERIRDTTIKHTHIGRLKALWRFAFDHRLTDIPPRFSSPVAADTIPTAWTEVQIRRLWKELTYLRGRVGEVDESSWWLGLHCVFWDTAERVGPLVCWNLPKKRGGVEPGIEWTDLSGDVLVVRAALRKGRRANESYRLHRTTMEILERLRRPSGPIFRWPKCQGALYHRYKRILAGGDLPTDRDHMFHCMRRSVVSFADAAGVNVRQIARHMNEATTRKHYVDSRVVGAPLSASDVLFRPGEESSRSSSAPKVNSADDLLKVAEVVRETMRAAAPPPAATTPPPTQADYLASFLRRYKPPRKKDKSQYRLRRPNLTPEQRERLRPKPKPKKKAIPPPSDVPADPGGTSLLDYIESAYFNRHELAASTQQQIELSVAKLDQFLRRTPRVADLNSEVLNRFTQWRLANVATRTARNDRDYLCGVGREAAIQGLIPSLGYVFRPSLTGGEDDVA